MQQKTSTDAVDTVAAYLDACHAGDWERAYALLSEEFQAMVPLSQFAGVKELPLQPLPDGLSWRFAAVHAFFGYQNVQDEFAYAVIGPADDSADVVIVDVVAPSMLDEQPFRIEIVTERDEHGLPRIALRASSKRTDPAADELAWQMAVSKSRKA